jgi:polygalacturonase
MQLRLTRTKLSAGVALTLSLLASGLPAQVKLPVFNVKDYGATGRKADNAQSAIRKALEACAQAGGGTVYLPPSEYTSGRPRLRSRVRVYLEAGATLFASQDPAAFDKPALLYGEDLENIAIPGRGTVVGPALPTLSCAQTRFSVGSKKFSLDF